ncbi:LOW QUALITY PROTEIN: hypothetical protein PanWU01x14_352490 [Parasponia andersonii]|uniref:Uncharacterized protein n=1 Tax=Parasponia andersonii TaxID=3476 RepID=A0A2P5AAB1_PARAD|nr:LOW QUALITY PROTEIN: hypothetical protein PanWU01x14_352490 [Parasponia andersonii]
MLFSSINIDTLISKTKCVKIKFYKLLGKSFSSLFFHEFFLVIFFL